MLDIRIENIKDDLTRDAIYNIVEEFRRQPVLNFFWSFFNVTFATGGTFTYTHNLGFMPKDYLITGISKSSTGQAYIDMDASTVTTISITVSEACNVRFLLGNLDINSQA